MVYATAMLPSEADVMAMAPDAVAVSAGRKLAAPSHWRDGGRDERALWGQCQGSALYQVTVDLADHVSKCSCPSRKFPCKHALGLLFQATRLPEGAPPDWASAWLSKRGAAAEAKAAKPPTPDKPPDPVQQAARAAKRQGRVEDGLAVLETWLEDLARQGLAGIERQPHAFWEQQAARLVDAQAPGLAARVRRLAGIPSSGPGWPERLAGGVGRLALLVEAYRGRERLPAPLQADLGQLVGWTLMEEQVRAHGDLVRDRWQVLGRRRELAPGPQQLIAQRTWLLGATTGRQALVLDFLAPGKAPAVLLAPGQQQELELVFWPSAWPQRALVAAALSAPAPQASPERGGMVADVLEAMAEGLARHPWLERQAALLAAVVPVPPAGDGPWHVIDAAGDALPLVASDPWRLLALSGGRPLAMAGEWDGHALRPTCCWIDGQAVAGDEGQVA